MPAARRGEVAGAKDGVGWETDSEGRLRHSGIWFTGTAGHVLTPSGYGVAVLANSGVGLGNEGTYTLENGIIDLLEGRTPGAVLVGAVPTSCWRR